MLDWGFGGWRRSGGLAPRTPEGIWAKMKPGGVWL